MPGGRTGRVVIVANSVSRNRFPRVKKKLCSGSLDGVWVLRIFYGFGSSPAEDRAVTRNTLACNVRSWQLVTG